ncbi:MAG TPA: glycoside hydrolase family 28 protein [Acidobacteriaceae bacterium]|jgi:polygalacturonase|nr:glycoside hydrolase family 28 protein [Acidobacteriaceae bacterium]
MPRSLDRRTFLSTTARTMLAAPLLGSAADAALAPTAQPAFGPTPPAYRAPGKIVLNVRDYGATGDGTTKDTVALQETIDRCAVLGGGEVLIPAGNYLTGAIALRSNTTLRLDKDAVLQGAPDFADYPVTQVRWEGRFIQGHAALIYAVDCDHIAVIGPGRINGDPALGGRPNKENPLRHPALIEFLRCRNIHLADFSTSYHLMWSIHPTDCENVVISGLTIRSTGGNGDGIDADSCRRVWIDKCDISTGDDCISLKSGRGEEGFTLHRPTEDVRITNCTFADSIFACIGIGSETSAGIRNVHVEHCHFLGARSYAVYIKTRVGRGAFLEDFSFNDLDVSGTKGGFLRINLLNSGIQDPDPVPGLEGIPTTGNFRFTNVRVTDCPTLVNATAIDPQKPLSGFTLANVTGTCGKGIELANMRNVDLRNIAVTGYSGPLLAIHNVTGRGLQGATPIEGPHTVEPVSAPAEPYKLH